MGNEGWIKVHRKLLDNWVWQNEKATRGQAWVDLLLTANHEDKRICINGDAFTVKEGQHFTSIRKLAFRWGWGEEKTLKFLRMLEDDGMIAKDSRTHFGTLITIVNWEVYQGKPNSSSSNKPSNKPSNKTEHKPSTNKKNKKNKEVKNIEASPFEGLDPNEMDDDTFDRWQKWRAEHESL